MALGLGVPRFAYAHGQEAVIYPLALLFALNLIPVADLLRRRAWSVAAFFIFTQPLVWCAAIAVAFSLWFLSSFLGEEIAVLAGFVSGLATLVVLPFLYWRYLIRKVVTNASA
ncbi:MAG: hypothetical protein D3M94_07610 [Rhodocyclales bacterium GT-UBC]|nr:MAG: hypothetical protein D3M94_07610 [Rhodocyclales bacterium GT-UBC]